MGRKLLTDKGVAALATPMVTTSANAVTSLLRSGAEAAKTIGPMTGSSLRRILKGAAGPT